MKMYVIRNYFISAFQKANSTNFLHISASKRYWIASTCTTYHHHQHQNQVVTRTSATNRTLVSVHRLLEMVVGFCASACCINTCKTCWNFCEQCNFRGRQFWQHNELLSGGLLLYTSLFLPLSIYVILVLLLLGVCNGYRDAANNGDGDKNVADDNDDDGDNVRLLTMLVNTIVIVTCNRFSLLRS